MGLPVSSSARESIRHSTFSLLELIFLCGVVLLAAWLRFYRLDHAEFLWDQAEISKWALRIGREGEFLWTGPQSSTGLATFPVAIWLMAIPYTLSLNPVFATGFVAAINLLAVVGCYFLTRHWFGRGAALVATTLFAVAPWAVIYSRKVWHTVLLPPLVLPYVVTGWLAFVRGRSPEGGVPKWPHATRGASDAVGSVSWGGPRHHTGPTPSHGRHKGRRWALVAHVLALAVLVQTHFSAFPFIALTILWAVTFRKRLDWKVVPLCVLLGAVTFVPYFVIDAQKGWENVHRFLEIVQKPAAVTADAIRATWIITTGRDLYWLTGPDRYPEFLAETPNARWLFVVEGGLAAVGFVAALWRSVRRAGIGLDDETAAVLMTATWLAMPALLLTRHSTIVAPHYLTTTLPAQFILIGWLVNRVRRLPGRIGRIGGIVFISLVVVIAVAQVYEITSLLRFVMTHDTRRGYVTPISYEIRAVRTARHLKREMGGTEVILLSEGDEPRMYEMPAVADVLMYNTAHRAVDIRNALVFPSDPAVYWATYEWTPGEELLASLTPEVTDARIPLREGARSFRFYRWPGGEPSLSCLQPLTGGPRTWANGAQLLGYCLEGDLRPGGTVHWTLVWRATRTSTEDVYYHWFNHLLDGQHQLQGQKDGPSLLPAYWRVGDTVLNWFDLQVSPEAPLGEYSMRVGMYTYPALENVPVSEASDGTGAEWIEIELPLMRE